MLWTNIKLYNIKYLSTNIDNQYLIKRELHHTRLQWIEHFDLFEWNLKFSFDCILTMVTLIFSLELEINNSSDLMILL